MAESTESYRLDGGLSHILPGCRSEKAGRLTGHVHTQFGTVIVDQYPDDALGHSGYTVYLRTAHRGRVYYRDRHRAEPFTARGLAMIAGRFAGDVAAMAARPAKK